MKRFEVILLIVVLSIALLIFSLSALLFPMNTDFKMPALLKWILGITSFIVMLYTCMRIKAMKSDYKWYQFLLQLVVFSLFFFVLILWACIDADMLIGAAFKGTHPAVLRIKSVEKEYHTKSGFIGGIAETNLDTLPLQFKTSRQTYFLIQNKSAIQVQLGKSLLGNYFITHIASTPLEKNNAAKQYWQNWWERHVVLFGVIGVVFLILISPLLISLLKGEKIGNPTTTYRSSFTQKRYYKNRQ